MLSDVLLVDGDLEVTEAKEIELVQGLPAVTQQIKHLIALGKDEFFLAPGEGVPWFDLVEKPISQDRLRSVLIANLAKEPSIETIEKFEFVKIGEREVQINYEVVVAGSRISGSEIL